MISEQLRATLLSLKLISNRIKNLILSLFDFRSTLMGDKGATRIRPLVVAKIVENGTEHCGFMAQAPNEDKRVFYDEITPDTGIFFFATKSEGLLSATEGLVDSFPLGVKSGVEAFYPIVDWLVCTQAPQDITSAASTWQTAVVQVGEVWRCKEEHKYYNSNNEYIGSVYVYEKAGSSEVTLGEVKASVENIDIDLTPVEEKVDEVSDKIDDIKDTFDADLAKEATLEAVSNKIGTPAQGQPIDLFAAIAAGGSGGTIYPTIQMTATTAAIDPNKVYIWGEVASLDISLNAGAAGVANVYFLEFYSGATATTLTLPASVTEIRGSIGSNRIFNVAIYNNIAYIG